MTMQIKNFRNQHGYSQSEIAELIGVSRQTFSQIEKGSVDLTLQQAKKLAEAFDASLENFLEVGKEIKKVILEKEKPKKEKQKLEIRVPRKNIKKFKEVLLYILKKVGAKPNIGETVIYKLLYFIDFDYYEKFEETIVGATYIKNQHGPTPVEFFNIVKEMEENEELEQVKSKYFKYDQKKYLPHRNPNLSLLSGREIEHIDDVLARLSEKNAKELSDYSHGDVPWIVHKFGEVISYETVFYRDEKYSVRNYDDEL